MNSIKRRYFIMTPLRQKMVKAMELRNLSKNTQRYYLSAVIGLSKYYHQSPDKLSEEMIEDYLVYLKNDRGNSSGTCANAVAGLRFFYNHVSERQVHINCRFNKKSVISGQEWTHLPPETGPTKPEIVGNRFFEMGQSSTRRKFTS
jgi:site-specific recombinase XerD